MRSWVAIRHQDEGKELNGRAVAVSEARQSLGWRRSRSPSVVAVVVAVINY